MDYVRVHSFGGTLAELIMLAYGLIRDYIIVDLTKLIL